MELARSTDMVIAVSDRWESPVFNRGERPIARTRFIEHEGRRILWMDFSGILDREEVLRVLQEAKSFVAAQPRARNLLTLVNVADTVFGAQGIKALKDLASHNAPWVLAGAAVGMTTVQHVICRLINTLTGRRLVAFETVEEAKAWLGQQVATAR
jgi:hypothetical protein